MKNNTFLLNAFLVVMIFHFSASAQDDLGPLSMEFSFLGDGFEKLPVCLRLKITNVGKSDINLGNFEVSSWPKNVIITVFKDEIITKTAKRPQYWRIVNPWEALILSPTKSIYGDYVLFYDDSKGQYLFNEQGTYMVEIQINNLPVNIAGEKNHLLKASKEIKIKPLTDQGKEGLRRLEDISKVNNTDPLFKNTNALCLADLLFVDMPRDKGKPEYINKSYETLNKAENRKYYSETTVGIMADYYKLLLGQLAFIKFKVSMPKGLNETDGINKTYQEIVRGNEYFKVADEMLAPLINSKDPFLRERAMRIYMQLRAAAKDYKNAKAASRKYFEDYIGSPHIDIMKRFINHIEKEEKKNIEAMKASEDSKTTPPENPTEAPKKE